jgi:ubiquinone/menaquinone biosynthesis C-methylase UbiE
MLELHERNQRQRANWNQASGRAWVETQDLLDRLFQPVADRLIEEGFPGQNRRVLDIGCGAGATTIAMARRLGGQGLCLGVDISEPLVELARTRVASADAGALRFILADAQTHSFEQHRFDAAISRFGVMFFDAPESAFTNIRRAVRPGGKLAFSAWRSPAENPFFGIALDAARPLLPDLCTPAADGPGQFAFADAARVERLLVCAGWHDVRWEPFEVPATLTRRDLYRYVTNMGPVGLALQSLVEPRRSQVIAALRSAYEPLVRQGLAELDLGCWLFTARS